MSFKPILHFRIPAIEPYVFQKREFILKVTFSVESPSSLLKLLIDLNGGCRLTRFVTFWHHRFCNATR